MDTEEVVENFKSFVGDKTANEALDVNAKRLVFDLSELRQHSREMVNSIMQTPMEVLPFLQEKLEEDLSHPVKLGFVGACGANFVTPRSIGSAHICKLICCEGIVTSVSLVRPKIAKSVHYDKIEKAFFQKVYRDKTMISKLAPTTTAYPKTNDKNPLTSEYGLSEYVDFQTFVLQEMPENAPPGQLPRSIECIISEDLVDKVKPGDRVSVYGIYKAFASDYVEFPHKFKTILIANHVQKKNENRRIETGQFNLESVRMLSQSSIKFSAVAPTIFGHSDIKKALALQMVGGNEIEMSNGGRIRGDINILLVGDPSTAKSQLLRFVMNFMPLTIATTGRGSTGVGLTAAVVLDKDTGDKRLEAGALVLGDRGTVCIDEFDKMNEVDRVAIHEVMEQQTVTIAKAGIHTTLNARCSVLAAANPMLGSYNDKISPTENVRLPESLMTRFDLVFVTLDNKDVERDQQIAEHVLKRHRGIADDEDNVISQELFRDYILYAKKLRPVLSSEASMVLSQAYTEFRSKKNDKALLINITPRLLETMIRLATAHAKLRLSETVEEVDANDTVEMIKTYLVDIVVKRERKHKIVRKFVKEEEDPKDEDETERNKENKENIDNKSHFEEKPEVKIEEKLIELDEETGNKLRNELFEWKRVNKDTVVIKLKDLAKVMDVEQRVLEIIINELAENDVVMFDSGTIYFLD